MRIALAIALGVVLGGGAVLGLVDTIRPSWLASGRDELGRSVATSTSDRPATVAPPTTSTDNAAAPLADVPAARPTTPTYARRPEASSPIYRCRSDGRTTYSNTPCEDGTVVDDSNAVTGFDSRPSVAMERLIAAGRARPLDVQSAPRTTAAHAPLVAAANVPCATMRQQIIDIDNQMRLPNSLRTLDDWRDVRQNIRTTMAREHC